MSDDGISWDQHAIDQDANDKTNSPAFPGIGDTAIFATLPFKGRVLDMGSNICRWYPAFKWLNTLNHGRDPIEYHAYDGSSVVKDIVTGLYPEVDLVIGDIFEMSSKYPANHFDTVFSSAFIQHFTNESKRKIMGEVHKILKPGGKFIMAEQMFFDVPDDYTNDRGFGITGWHIFMTKLNFLPSRVCLPYMVYYKVDKPDNWGIA